jgi:hypothetical protein
MYGCGTGIETKNKEENADMRIGLSRLLCISLALAAVMAFALACGSAPTEPGGDTAPASQVQA